MKCNTQTSEAIKMSEIVEYKLLRREEIRDLESAVNSYIQQRWQPFGAPFGRANDCGKFQALVKYREEVKP